MKELCWGRSWKWIEKNCLSSCMLVFWVTVCFQLLRTDLSFIVVYGLCAVVARISWWELCFTFCGIKSLCALVCGFCAWSCYMLEMVLFFFHQDKGVPCTNGTLSLKDFINMLLSFSLRQLTKSENSEHLGMGKLGVWCFYFFNVT